MLNRLLVAALLTAIAMPAVAAERTLPLAEALRRADAVVLATVDDPATDQTLLPVPGAPDFVRLQRRLRVNEVLSVRGVPLAARKAVHAGVLLRVDDPLWRQDLAAHRACHARDAKATQRQEPCAMPEKDAYASDLTREPRPGQPVLLLLVHTVDGWALALDRAMDLPAKAATARVLLKRAK